jgi:hypothetical protein
MTSDGSPRYRFTSSRSGEADRLDHVAGEEAVLRAHPRIERQLGDPMRDEVQVRRLLHVLGEELEEARVVDRVVVVVPGVHVEPLLGDRPGRDVEHVREALSHGGIEGLVHVHDPLPAGEVRRAQPHHAHPRR